MLNMYVHNLLSMKHFHEALAGNIHECSLKLSIGKVSYKKRSPKIRADTVGELKSAEIGVSNMPVLKAKKLRKLLREKVLLELEGGWPTVSGGYWVLGNNRTRNRCKRSMLGRKCLTFCEKGRLRRNGHVVVRKSPLQ
jgi:hypothetical protein